MVVCRLNVREILDISFLILNHLYAFNCFRFGHHALHEAVNDMHIINIWLRLQNEVICPEQKKNQNNACIFVLDLYSYFINFSLI